MIPDLTVYKDDPRILREWLPDYTPIYGRRVDLFAKAQRDVGFRQVLLKHYEHSPLDFILDCITTYDPRNAGTGVPTTMPFCLFWRQVELITLFIECLETKNDALVEKVRDAGATMCACAFAIWMWRFMPGTNTLFGSRKEMLVDRLGDPGSIFEKIRQMINYLPDFILPAGFSPKQHMTYMKVINPANGAQITGEAGDGIGRGGRSTVAFCDESAHYERPELIEAALGDNTDVRIDISSVNGTGNVFYRRRKAGTVWTPGADIPKGKTRVFVFDWREHPGKTPEWYARRRAKAEAEGLMHVFAQEVDRDYSSAVEGVVIPAKWVQACIDAHVDLGWPEPSGPVISGMDVADDGGDVNSMCVTHDYLVRSSVATGGEADKVGQEYYMLADMLGVRQWRYEVTGVGTGARSGAKTYRQQALAGGRPEASLPAIHGWDPSAGVVNPQGDITTGERVEPGDKESRRNKDHFANLKAQAWWHLRRLCHNTYRTRYEGAEVDPSECLSIPSTLDGREELINELSQATYKPGASGKLVIEKKPNGAKSPNRADALVIAKSPMKLQVVEPIHLGARGIDTVHHVAIGT